MRFFSRGAWDENADALIVCTLRYVPGAGTLSEGGAMLCLLHAHLSDKILIFLIFILISWKELFHKENDHAAGLDTT